ncbi:MAG TPA: sigma-54 dependent transcriptional regulator [Vicinamibacteria bacterium]|jgi:DNA-binding NtrC family response regulator|nr:sigma-54 dependent transcriptional regulator [Vicinamibacteria bacterium]
MKPRILIVDDDPGTLASLSRAFALEGYTALTASSAARALERLSEEPVDAILTDVVMPEMDGLDFLARLRERAPELPVILMSGQATVETAVRATRLGALDFVEKPVGLDRLLLTLRNALRIDRLERENRELQAYWKDELALVGESAPMAALRSLIERAAPSDMPILVTGENGTGKELVARAIHDLSPRRGQAFLKMNCAAVPAELVESELFGHEKGAFSGALAQRRGRFEQADGGTLFLDEIGDMPAAMQAKLLRVLQDGEITRVGGTGETKVDVRLISATNRDLDALLAEGSFREDLYYRISTVTVRTPALREHPQDIPALAAHFADAACRRNHWRSRRIAPDAFGVLEQQSWRGNVRELKNVVERALILSEGEVLSAREIRPALPVLPRVQAQASPDGLLRDLVDEFEKDVIRERLRRSGGHVTNAAKSLGLERSHLYKKCKQLGLDIREEP